MSINFPHYSQLEAVGCGEIPFFAIENICGLFFLFFTIYIINSTLLGFAIDMRVVFLLFFLSGISILSFSQNLILNGDFEDVNVCTEYHQKCSCHAWRLTSFNLPIYALTENKNVKIAICHSALPNVRTYLESRLGDTLIIGEKYVFSMDVMSEDLIINEFGVLFSDKLIVTRIDTLIDVIPDILFGDNVKILRKSKIGKWIHLEAEFVAESQDTYILIGCFTSEQNMIRKLYGKDKFYKNYYYSFDNISLVSESNLHDPMIIEQTKQLAYSQHERHPVSDDLFSAESFIINDIVKIKANIEEHEVITNMCDTIVLSNTLLFEFDSYEITSLLTQALDSIFLNLKKTPNAITIIGHTDNIGIKEYNEDLSLKRAKSIAEYLDEREIISIDKTICYGKGSNMPVADNNTEEGRQNNRRVEIIIRY